MIGIFIFICIGIIVMRAGYPLQFAGVYVVLTSLLSLLLGESFTALLFSAIIMYAYTAFVYMLVDTYGDRIFLPIVILVGGAFVWVGALFFI